MTANGINQCTAAAGATLTHDTKGNLTGDGVWTYTYDLDNQLISANKTGSTNSLAYDGAGRLRQTTLAGTVTGLTYDGVDLVAEYNSGGTLLRRYVHGPGIDEPLVWYEGTTTTNKTWLYQDQLGSVIGTANSAGTSTAIHSYGPYGEPNIATGTRFRYTGQQFIGSLNLYYYKARFYSPALGRFLQTDPIGIADDLNLYAYVGNNPINFNDPSGLSAAAASMLLGKVGGYMNGIQTSLDIIGLIPGFGELADLLNGTIYTIRGDYVNAGFSYGAAIPFVGWGATAGKFANKADNLGGNAANVFPIKPGSANGSTAGQVFPKSVKDAAKAENPTATCVYCQMEGTGTQVDHAIPRARGGNATLDNAQLACPHCNTSKGAGDFPKTPPSDYVGPWPPEHW